MVNSEDYSVDIGKYANGNGGFEYVATGTDKRNVSGKDRAAILFAELGGVSEDVMKYLSTDDIKKLRKQLKKLNSTNNGRVSIPVEAQVLEDANKWGITRRISDATPEQLNSTLYFKKHKNDKSKEALHNLVKNKDAVANVLSVWIKEDK